MKRLVSDFRCRKTNRLYNAWFLLCSTIDVWFCIGAETNYFPYIFLYKQKGKSGLPGQTDNKPESMQKI